MEYHVELSVVVPTYQSAYHITAFLDRMRPVFCRYEGRSELIMVDDGSDDDTSGVIWSWVQSCLLRKPAGPALGEKATVRGKTTPEAFNLKLIRLEKNSGQQAATLCGIAAASGTVIVTVDDDLQHRPEDIPRLVDALSEGWDLVYGVPRERYGRRFRSIGSAARNLLFLLIFGSRAQGIKPTSFRAFRAELGKSAAGEPEGFLYLSAEFFRRTGRITGIPVAYEHAGERHSRYPLRKLFGTFAGILLYCPFFPGRWREKS
ncbi:MAG: glycosyltransferase, partial [Spirochaetota bacterium]|nr:glycosyltransferase [Spirochaetota bacterium]